MSDQKDTPTRRGPAGTDGLSDTAVRRLRFGAASDGWEAYASWLDRVRQQPGRTSRQAVISDGAAPAAMDPRWFVKSGDPMPESITFPTPRNPRENQQEQFVRDLEIDPAKYYPRGVFRDPTQTWPGVTINPREMLAQRGIELDPDWRKPG